MCARRHSSDKELFKRWYSQAGTPRVTVSSSYDAQAHTLTLTCAQSTPPTPGQPTKDPVLIPFPVALFDRQGRALSLKLEDEPFLTGKTEELLQLTTNVQTWVFTGCPVSTCAQSQPWFRCTCYCGIRLQR